MSPLSTHAFSFSTRACPEAVWQALTDHGVIDQLTDEDAEDVWLPVLRRAQAALATRTGDVR
jgi:hypothetical protein